MNELITFNKVFSMNFKLLRLMSSSNNYSYEDMKEVAMFVYFTNPDIEKLYLEDKIKDCNREFLKCYRKEVNKDNVWGYPFQNSKNFPKVFNRAVATFENESIFDAEEDLFKKELLKKCMSMLNKKEQEFLINAYEFGSHIMSQLYGISQRQVNRRIKALVERIRGGLDEEISNNMPT